jgi:hypothetical protein
VVTYLPAAAALKGREMITAILGSHRRMLTLDPARR